MKTKRLLLSVIFAASMLGLQTLVADPMLPDNPAYEETLRAKLEEAGLPVDEEKFQKLVSDLKSKNVDLEKIRFRGPSAAPSETDFIGKPGPEFHVKEWISEKPEMEGKFLLIDFWATWCGPCIQSIPHVNDLHASFKDEVTLVGLSRESRAKVESMSSPKMDYYSAIDPEGRMSSFFQIRGIPHMVLMSPEGTVLWKGHPARLSASALQELISQHKEA
ncbi:thioredoxin domain-containing protein [Pelagicoccus enzymogenes]|uniref:redoxin domain-containing protein n=1 Tax=Pelagicoccus enzymogenes TaxID=2773457 RepID=UPI00280F3300|nr:redoxin domain-containing protein [Pelagicoccus enzymogenes]MDQ8199579.1 thioredoxin domain-containing protein [Pelagicoccus enzymogenes]